MLNVMTAEQVAKTLKNKEELFILDVRNESDFQNWKIEGENVELLNIPYFDLIDGVEQALSQIPVGKKLLVVCAKEGSSKFVAEQIVEAGRENVHYLHGGMKAWSEHLEQVIVYEDQQVKVYQFIRVGKGCLSYMVLSGKEALVVDPSRFTDLYQKVAQNEGVTIKHIVDSHLHADHISGGNVLADATGASYYLMKSEGAVFDFKALEDHEHIQFELVDMQVLAVKTPGHTPGSVSFLVNDKLLFSGDTIFVGGLGRPDLGGKVREWAEDLYETVYDKVSQMADDVIVLPAHYANLDDELNQEGYIGAALGDIREKNELMRNKNKSDFIDSVAASAHSETPPNFEEIVAINRGVEEATPDRQQELEIGPNRCAVHHFA
ncbi:MBL fold metallo-hydrolase [Brevibacillus centrosporus]|jgi:glyoxylase-like metal-dependent hydrolase (beta-lactamase superfamily II)|uniref:MBL fold metallo-hydrolase n=1 Tax=Brevibacillus centrosporus TaxID=54910 RepID=UPI000F0A805D|nr:MBL fold metallo-hydrolase [Brevibacillus centrosporus]MEC2133411.1 MBL fold metallo-hydrolase [Brevibacillus centrosporus]RNB67762.1 MBL fold metallo-hydrolase [Brevibacillus centrosporus]GED34122.1 hydroxyacylglutathione hydrolase [Brevibacillus centrosporus]